MTCALTKSRKCPVQNWNFGYKLLMFYQTIMWEYNEYLKIIVSVFRFTIQSNDGVTTTVI